MKILKDTTLYIQMENLDFKIKYSNISEINNILSALDKMKAELHNSLNKEWKKAEVRKIQIGALAHDIKTPLTIIKGNAELLNELNLTYEQGIFNERILNEITNMESYVKSLLQIMNSEKDITLQKKQLKLEDFIKNICEESLLLTENKKLNFITKIKYFNGFLQGDEIVLKRAILNVVSNAVDYAPLNGKILFSVDKDVNYIKFTIEDSGRGFTKEERLYATEQFFQGDKSRNSKNHYGMGLYITKNFIAEHNGSITLDNSEILGGSKVILRLPLN